MAALSTASPGRQASRSAPPAREDAQDALLDCAPPESRRVSAQPERPLADQSPRDRSLPKLSVIIITKNEAHNIGDCLASVAFADECIVVDSGSSDETVSLAREKGAMVEVFLDWPGFGPQKNRALALATGDWVLSIDADERVLPGLRAEIEAAIASPSFDMYSFPRLSSYCGQTMRHSGWYPDRVTRLFKRGMSRFSDDLVHESLLTSGPVGKLEQAISHESYRNLEDVLTKTNRYSSAGAAGLQRRGRRSSLGTALGHGAWAFFRTYFLRFGVLDGKLGFVLAVSIAEETYYRYLKLWLLTRSAKAD
jgi:glycosyltransferase involved in cell wall biosynthesis